MIHQICMRPWRFAMASFRIAGNVYYVGNRDVSSHLIDTGDGLILLDTTFPQSAYLLLESIRRLGFDPDEVKYILHSHGHYDHFGGTKALVELTGATTFLGEADIEILEELPELSWAPEYGVQFYEAFAVDHALRDGEVISLGNTSIQCVHIPGHTPGSMAYFFETADRGRMYRVGIHGGPGLNTLTDAYLLNYGLPTSRRIDYMSSLRRLQEERVDIPLGAHPAQNDTLGKRILMTDQRNPFIDETAWPRFLNSLKASARAAFETA